MNKLCKELYENKVDEAKLSQSLQKEWDKIDSLLEDFMMHTEMISDEASDPIMKKAWMPMDKGYEDLKVRVKRFIQLQAKMND